MKKNYYQFIRGICVILVVLIHTLYLTNDYYINIFNIIIRRLINFAVPTFLFIAAYFTKYKDVKTYYEKRFVRVIIPLIIWMFIYGLIKIIINKPTIIDSIKYILFGGYHLYYLVVLAMLVIITPLLIKYINKNNNCVIVLSPLLVTLIFNIIIFFWYSNTGKMIPFCNYLIFGWFSYYYLGLLINYKKDYFSMKKYNNIYIFISMIISIIEGIFLYTIFNSYDFAVSQITISNFFYSLMIVLFLNSNQEKKINESIITKFGDYSYGIYLSHVLILLVVKKIISYLHLNYLINILLIFILTILIVYFFNWYYYEKIKKVFHGHNCRKK